VLPIDGLPESGDVVLEEKWATSSRLPAHPTLSKIAFKWSWTAYSDNELGHLALLGLKPSARVRAPFCVDDVGMRGVGRGARSDDEARAGDPVGD
jgi:hypothetical protein